MDMSRREFIRKMTALGFTVATASALFTWLGCRPVDTNMPTWGRMERMDTKVR